jgi:hypothetical protein
MRKAQQKRFRWLLAIIGTVFLGVIIGVTTNLTNRVLEPVLPPPAKVGDGDGAPPGESFGYLKDIAPARAAAVLPTLKHAYFSDAGRKLMQAPGAEDKDALLYKAADKVLGKTLPAHDQDGTGCCVGEGTSGAVELLDLVQIAMGGEFEFKPVSAAAVYSLAREAGGYLGTGDGSTGHDAAKAITTRGTVDCETAKDTNGVGGTAQSHAQLAKKWGGSGGLPSELKEVAKKHLVKTASLVRTPEEARAALQNGYPIFVCSDVGFTGGGGFKRDSEGFCHRGGNWSHCMYCCGYRADKKAFCIVQSWGPTTPSGSRTLGQPESSFWISWEDMAAIVRQGDSYAVSGHDGFPAQEINWIVRAPEPSPVRVAKALQLLRRDRETQWALAP